MGAHDSGGRGCERECFSRYHCDTSAHSKRFHKGSRFHLDGLHSSQSCFVLGHLHQSGMSWMVVGVLICCCVRMAVMTVAGSQADKP